MAGRMEQEQCGEQGSEELADLGVFSEKSLAGGGRNSKYRMEWGGDFYILP